MNQEQLAPILIDRKILIAAIIDTFKELEVEELEAIECYCHNYHHVYQKAGKNYIVTEITIEPMKERKKVLGNERPSPV